jgi:FkbM family methyltransferase
MLHTIKAKIKEILKKDVQYILQETSLELKKLGSAYGGWIIPIELINANSICYSAGAGEDISFDISLANHTRCQVFIFDPTPRAKLHFQKVVEAARLGQPLSYNNNEWYDLTAETPAYLHFFETGLWCRKDSVKFFAPKDGAHVSHSISNLQKTETYFEAQVERLSSIMKANNHNTIDLLKIDIEGAEFDVIDTLIEDKLDIKIFCVEFHKKKGAGFNKIQEAISKLENYGYRVIAREHLDFTFIKMPV